MAKLPKPPKVNLRRLRPAIPQLTWLPTQRMARWPRSIVMLFVVLIVTVFMSLFADIVLTGEQTDFRIAIRSEAQLSQLPACQPAELAASQFAVEVRLNRKWHVIGKEFISRDPLAGEIVLGNLPINCSPRELQLEYRVDKRTIEGRQQTANKTNYTFNLNINELGVGTYSLVAEIRQKDELIATQTQPFYVSKPVYVAWTLDWEGYNFSDTYLNQIQELTDREQKVPLTHFFNPFYSISGGTLQSRGTRFANWIKERQPTYGDEVGLHLHMFYAIATAAGVTPREQPSWSNTGTGAKVPFSSYTYAEQSKILAWAKQNLINQGFTNLKSFRAGGWYANLDTLRALQDNGFVIESSGRTAYGFGGIPGPWQLQSTTQPYFPCIGDQNKACTGAAAFQVMELPNNGADSYHFQTTELATRFRANYNGQPQESHKVITYLSHPEWFNIDRPKMTELFRQIDESLYTADRGPVIYTTLENIYYAQLANI